MVELDYGPQGDIPETYECDLFYKSKGKHLDMSSSWIIWMDPKSNDKYPHKGKAEEGLT